MNKKLLAFLCCLTAFVCVVCGCTQETPQTDNENASVSDAATDEAAVSDENNSASDENVSEAVFADGAELGEGALTLTVKVVDADKNESTFTVKTDAENLGDALTDAKLVSGEQGAYGLYIKYVNGMRADYDLDKAYWGLYKQGELLMTGASDTPVADGEQYELVYTAG